MGMQKLTIELDDGLLKAARVYAIEHNTTLSFLIQEYLMEVVGFKVETTQPPPSVSFKILETSEVLPSPETSLPEITHTDKVAQQITEMFSQLLKKS